MSSTPLGYGAHALATMLVKQWIVAVAMVPFHRKICQALGSNYFVKPDSADNVNTQVDRSRTVAIGGILSSTLLTLPMLNRVFHRDDEMVAQSRERLNG